ncbi:MFS transporter [Streptosporangium soli]|nr:MFS transporter [Streptosporangium sp. KLBMP 9127]
MAAGTTADSGRRVIAVLVCVQLAASLGYYAVMAHLVAHLRDDVGLLAGTISLALGLRIAVQYALFLPFGPLIDQIGPRRAGMLACALRAIAFGLLGVVDGPGTLLATAMLLAIGGALFHPSAQSMLAGLPSQSRSRGFGAYVVTGQIAAVAGPPVGLALLGGGFAFLAAASAAVWAVAALLFGLLRQVAGPTGRAGLGMLLSGVADVARDRPFLRFAAVTAPSTLLISQVVTVVPLSVADAGQATLFFCAVAVAAAGVQPFVARDGRGGHSWVLRVGLLCAGFSYLLLAAFPFAADWRMAALMTAAVLNGLGTGLLQPASFQMVVRCAPEGRVGSYNGLVHFMSGMVAFAGGLVVGQLFDQGAVTAALVGLAAVGTVSAAAHRHPRGPQQEQTVVQLTASRG